MAFAFLRNFTHWLRTSPEDEQDIHGISQDGTGTRCGVLGALGNRPFVTCRDCLRLMAEDERGY